MSEQVPWWSDHIAVPIRVSASFMKRLDMVFLALLLGAFAWAQNGPTFKVLIPFIAKDSHNHLVSTLTHESLIISDDKTAITDFDLVHATDLPLEVGVLIDTSGSQRSTSLPEAWQAAKDFVNNIARAGDDRAFFLTFSDKAETTPWLTKGDLAGASINLTLKGPTALYDSIAIACKRMGPPDWQKPSRRVIIVLSDGEDNASHITLAQAESAALKYSVIIFTVGTQESPIYAPRRSKMALEQIADVTGGESFTGLSRTDMPKVFANVKELMSGMYYASYTPPDRPADHVHQVDIKPSSKQKFSVGYPRKYLWFQ